MKFKGIMSRIIVSVVPVIALSMVLFMLIINSLMKSQINAQVNNKIEESLEKLDLAIQKEFSQNAEIAKSFAVYAETSSLATFDRGEVKFFLMKSILLNKNTLGGGIWYEPYACYSNIETYGLYAYKDSSGKAVYEPNYENIVDFYKEEWYINGGKSKGDPIWSSVFYDPLTTATMITATVPFFDEAGKMRGVATSDMALTDIQKIVDGVSVGTTSKVFILGRAGEYITFYDDSRKIDDTITREQDANLAAFGNQALQTRKGIAMVETAGGSMRTFYSEIEATGWLLVLMVDNSEISHSIFSLVSRSAVVPLIGLLIATLFLFFVAVYLRRIAKKINRFAMVAAGGDFSKRIEITERDEFGDLEEHLNQMMEHVCSIYVESMETNDNIVDTAKHFSSLAQQTKNLVALVRVNVDEMGSSLNSLASTGEKVNIAANTVASGAQSAAEKGSDIAKQIDAAMKASENGMNAVRQVVKDIEKVAQDVSDSAHSIQELGTRTHQIQNFVAQISGIAAQTNLLALNAAIEASRSGEAGRGFAVVAEEVRKLAEDSDAAAKNIATLANTISKDLEKTVGVSKSNLDATQKVRDLSTETEEIIGNMITYLGSIAGATQDLAVVSEEQASSSGEIARAVHNIAQEVSTTAQAGENIHNSIGDVASSAESMAKGAENLSVLADGMKAIFDVFTIDAQGKEEKEREGKRRKGKRREGQDREG
ncbi:MAG: methyl-accepting chemotaxis protein [Synergistaceae bacterium]|jgi:methyl-accepting chemotaxis protein|nr:methyl-accepting chemotaxis protein [Synergistaceae bacterium]